MLFLVAREVGPCLPQVLIGEPRVLPTEKPPVQEGPEDGIEGPTLLRRLVEPEATFGPRRGRRRN